MAWIFCLGFLWCNYFLSVELSNFYGGYDKIHVNGYIFLGCKTLLCFLLETWNFLIVYNVIVVIDQVFDFEKLQWDVTQNRLYFLMLKHYDISTFLDSHCQVKK